MKLAYLARFDRTRDVGIYNKIQAQVKSFNDMGFETKLIPIKVNVIHSFINNFVNVIYNWKDIKIDKDTDALYIRYPMSSFGFISFLKHFKKGSPGRRVILEIPTYPYDGEERKEELLINIKDKICRNFLKKYVDRVVTFSTDDLIFGIKTIKIQNGADFSKIKEKKAVYYPSEEIHMIAVATMKPWHGYDRLIAGMKNYYHNQGSRQIYLHLVGTGSQLSIYQELVLEYKLQKNVIFYNQKTGNELDKIYDRCDLGVLSLGNFRKGLFLSSELKSKEYAAKGLPMIGAGKIDIFQDYKLPYILHYPSNEDAINIYKLIAFYDKIYIKSNVKKEEIIHQIRHQAEIMCDIKLTMEPVIHYIKSR